MTNRVNDLIVVLKEPVREDDVQALMNAIALFDGVIDVKPQVANITSYIAMEEAKHELRQKIWDVLK